VSLKREKKKGPRSLLQGYVGDEVRGHRGQLAPKQRDDAADGEVFGVEKSLEARERGEDGPKQGDSQKHIEDDEVEVLPRGCSHQMALRRDAFHS